MARHRILELILRLFNHGAGVDALCGSTLMIGLDELREEGLLAKSDLPKKIPVATVDYNQV